MAGTKDGGRKAAATNKARYSEGFYARTGSLGGQVSHPNKGFGSDPLKASIAGIKGGKISRKGKSNGTKNS